MKVKLKVWETEKRGMQITFNVYDFLKRRYSKTCS